jgi:excinuclease ABC subunit C
MLQRIRDEAHRVANGYNELLLRRRISESLLDDIPGVSPARKKALLAEFGSIARIRRMTPETIARVPGVSGELARKIAERLSPPEKGRVPDPERKSV